MITEKTLFILGAGSHVPYGFPDAKQLKQKIIIEYPGHMLSFFHGNEDYSRFHRDAIESDAKSFTKAFEDSGINSIDLFLSLRPEFSTKGKNAIILSMLTTEIRHRTNKALYNKEEWFRYLYNRSLEGIYSPDQKNKYFDNKFAFLTFNYDRMIENYFAQNLSATFNLAPEHLYQYFEHLKIRHIYGSLAFLSSQQAYSANNFILDYGKTINLKQLELMNKNIKIINEERNTCEDLSDIISSYDRIFFLGFSYADENMKVLNIPGCLRKGQQVFGTAFKATPNEIENIKTKFLSETNYWTNDSTKDLHIMDQDNLMLLRNYL